MTTARKRSGGTSRRQQAGDAEQPGDDGLKSRVAQFLNLPPRSDAELEVMKDSRSRNAARRTRVSAKVVTFPGQPEDKPKVWVGEPHDDKRGWMIRLADAFGTSSDDFAGAQLHAIFNMAQDMARGRGEVDGRAVNSMLAAVDGMRPVDEIEGMLAVQMATTHALAMSCLMRTHRASSLEHLDANGKLANKLLRTYVAQVEALAKIRRGGEQKVEVKHVHVHEGGQAIVGHVTHNAGGGGGSDESGRQPHEPRSATVDPAALAFAPGVPLWSEEPSREPVPGARNTR